MIHPHFFLASLLSYLLIQLLNIPSTGAALSYVHQLKHSPPSSTTTLASRGAIPHRIKIGIVSHGLQMRIVDYHKIWMLGSGGSDKFRQIVLLLSLSQAFFTKFATNCTAWLGMYGVLLLLSSLAAHCNLAPD